MNKGFKEILTFQNVNPIGSKLHRLHRYFYQVVLEISLFTKMMEN